MRISTGVFVLLSLLGACSSDKPNGSGDEKKVVASPSPEVRTTSQATATTRNNPCEHTGQWASCSLERRLKQSGFVLKKLDEKPSRPGFNVRPVVYSLGSSRLEVFIYDNEAALQRDLRAIDTVAVAPKGSTASWPSTPTLIRSANLAAVLLTQNPRQAERVVLAITAGPPQPGSPR